VSNQTSVDRLFIESKAILAAIPDSEISVKNSASDLMRKALLLGAASYFEHRVTAGILDYVMESVQDSQRVFHLVKNKAVSRNYHTWFQWDQANANGFFSMFGPEFKEAMDRRVKSTETLSRGVRAFLELGNDRNKLVHGDFASFAMEKTLDEIYTSYQEAATFVEDVRVSLRSDNAVQSAR